MIIREFRPSTAEFEQMVECYRSGFPGGHNRYALARLARMQRETILVAEELGRIVGLVIGICSSREAWITSLTVLPEDRFALSRISPRLLRELGHRLVALGFTEALATTKRKSVVGLATAVGATLVEEEQNFYFDGQQRLVFRARADSLSLLGKLC